MNEPSNSPDESDGVHTEKAGNWLTPGNLLYVIVLYLIAAPIADFIVNKYF